MNAEYNIGEKIKKRRLEKGITQSLLVSDKITRSMLSLIESGKATPSIETAAYLCRELDLPLSYLFSKDNDLFYYEKKAKIDYAKELYVKGNYEHCISVLSSLSSSDDETEYLLAMSYYKLGRDKAIKGSLVSAAKMLNSAISISKNTIYDTSEISICAPIYLAISNNIDSPLLEFDAKAYSTAHTEAFDYEFYKYMILDFDFEYKNETLRLHMEAKALLKKYDYMQAISKLSQIEVFKNSEDYNAFVFFGIYTDLESAYKQIGDFENAYRYASKRLSLLTAFKS